MAFTLPAFAISFVICHRLAMILLSGFTFENFVAAKNKKNSKDQIRLNRK